MGGGGGDQIYHRDPYIFGVIKISLSLLIILVPLTYYRAPIYILICLFIYLFIYWGGLKYAPLIFILGLIGYY